MSLKHGVGLDPTYAKAWQFLAPSKRSPWKKDNVQQFHHRRLPNAAGPFDKNKKIVCQKKDK